MTEDSLPPASPSTFEYELLDVDSDNLKTVVATPNQPSPIINPSDLKLKHRIGRGTFGDVWLATHHQKSPDFEEYHEVAVKMLHPLHPDFNQTFLDKFSSLFPKLRQLPGVCWLHGASLINGKISIVMKFHSGSIADKLALSKTRKLQLSDALRYAIELGKTVAQLHEIGVLVLNLKPSNFLLDDQNGAVLGDFGLPYLLLGSLPLDSAIDARHGTPNYMSPEQWKPEEIGPLTSESDSWGFACSFLEMLTGTPPWYGIPVNQIRRLVIADQTHPQLPRGLPSPVHTIISACFEHDLRHRPSMKDVLFVLQSSLNDVSRGVWAVDVEGEPGEEKINQSTWVGKKIDIQVGDMVRSRKEPNPMKQPVVEIENGLVAELDGDRSGFVLIKIPGKRSVSRVHDSTLERVSFGFAAGDWVRIHERVGVVHSVDRNGMISVGFVGLNLLHNGSHLEVQPCDPYYVGQFVRLKSTVHSPTFEWPFKRANQWATGRISRVLPNGCLEVSFPGRFSPGTGRKCWLANPTDVEVVSFDTCNGLVEKYQHVEDFHWAARPVSVAVGLVVVAKLMFAGRAICNKINNINKKEREGEGNNPWLANILFKRS